MFKQGFNQKVQEGQEKLQQMWVDWSKKSSEESGDKTSAEAEVLPWGGKQWALGILLIFNFFF